MITYQIAGVVFSRELAKLERPRANLLLNPQVRGSKMADSPQTLALADSDGGNSIRVNLDFDRDAEVSEDGLDPHRFRGGFGHSCQRRLSGG